MAWRSSGRTNTELITNLFNNNVASHPRVKAAMLEIDRINYSADRNEAYLDSPHTIGFGLVCISIY